MLYLACLSLVSSLGLKENTYFVDRSSHPAVSLPLEVIVEPLLPQPDQLHHLTQIIFCHQQTNSNKIEDNHFSQI